MRGFEGGDEEVENGVVWFFDRLPNPFLVFLSLKMVSLMVSKRICVLWNIEGTATVSVTRSPFSEFGGICTC